MVALATTLTQYEGREERRKEGKKEGMKERRKEGRKEGRRRRCILTKKNNKCKICFKSIENIIKNTPIT